MGSSSKDANMMIYGKYEYILDGFWKDEDNKITCFYGRTSQASYFDKDDFLEISVFRFKSVKKATKYATALKLLADYPGVIDVLFVNESVEDADGFCAHVIVDKMEMDMISFVQTKLVEMELKKKSSWSVYGGNYFKTVFRRIVVIYQTLFNHPTKVILFQKLMNSGAIAVDNNGIPRLTRIKLSNGNNQNVDRTAVIHDLGLTMEEFFTRGAKAIKTTTVQEKMRILKVDPRVICFIQKCKNFNIQNNIPIKWLLDSILLWEKKTLVDWIFELPDIVKQWTSNSLLVQQLDSNLDTQLQFRQWRTFLPNESRTQSVFCRFEENIRDYRNKVGPRYILCHFYEVAQFYRNMLKHFDDPYGEEDLLGEIEISKMVEGYFPGGLSYILRDVIESVFISQNRGRARWMNLLSSEFQKLP